MNSQRKQTNCQSLLKPMLFFLLILSLTNSESRAVLAQANESPSLRPVVVLHSYLASPSRLAKLRQAAAKLQLGLNFVAVDSVDEKKLVAEIRTARICLLDIPHASVAESIVKKCAASIGLSKIPYVIIGDLDQVSRSEKIAFEPLACDFGVSSEWAASIRKYYRFAGEQNTQWLIEYLSRDLPAENSTIEIPLAKPFPGQGFYHPQWQELETELSAVMTKVKRAAHPIVAISVNRAALAAEDTLWLDKLIATLAERDIESYAFYGPRQNSELFTQMTCSPDDSARPLVNCIINAALVFRPLERKAELDRNGVPVFQSLPALNVDAKTWEAGAEGLAVPDIAYYYASSELAGMIDPLLISARNQTTGLLEPIEKQIAAMADRIQSVIRLQASLRSDRQITMMVYNYPQGENNFGASFLNVPKSLVNVLAAMQNAGYTTEIPSETEITSKIQSTLRALYDRSSLVALYTAGEADLLPLHDYELWFATLPASTRERIQGYWGPPASTAIQIPESEQVGFVIPMVRLGNVRITPQPLRHEVTTGTEESLRKKRIGHKSTVPLSHTYLATYLCLRTQWKTHALIHFGTHGTLEWAPGKSRALSIDDDPYLALGAMPNIYPYIMDNLGEATTAKRRGRATIISHLTPMFTPAGFRPGLHEMHDLMHDWETVAPGPVREQTEKQLVARFVDFKLDRDLNWTPDRIAKDFHGFMEVLHPYLDDIAQSAQPQGLATFGEVPSQDRRFGMVMQMLRKPLIDALGEDIDEVFLLDAEKVIHSRPARWLRLALEDPQAASQLDLRKIDQLDKTRQTSVPNRAAEKSLDANVLLSLAKRAQQLDNQLSSNEEIASLLAALDGKHVPSSYGGDPVRNPESLPTGRNLYGFDPTRVPTQQAWEIGVGVLNEWLATYRYAHDGKLPEQIAFTMWAGETMRHQGVMESQVLYAMGARPRWDEAGRMSGIEMMAANELGRPRIDVLLSVTGSYRDQFPQLMLWIDKAVREVADVNEPTNAIAKHVSDLRQELEANGATAEIAARQASIRVFSNEAGGYGTGLNDAVYASDLWEKQSRGGGDAQLAKLFIERMGFAYGDGVDSVAAASLFAKQLKKVDVAFLSRSSNTYGVLTSDDPFAYLGGFTLASRISGGKVPELYVQNLRDESEVIIDSASAALAKEMQTRYLHPNWIKSQQREGYSGTLQVLKAAQFLWGWQVTAPESVREDQWQSMFDVYVNDQYQLGTREWFKKDNQHAMAQMLERMVDAMRLDYWKPNAATRRDLLAAFQQAKEASKLIESNPAVAAFVAKQSEEIGKPDLSTPINNDAIDPTPSNALPTAEPKLREPAAQASEQVRGLELKPLSATAEPAPVESMKSRSAIAICTIIALVCIGGWLQHRRLLGKNQRQR